MFKIYIEDLKIEAIIGILEKERISPQKVIVNIQIDYSYKDNFLNYQEIANFVEHKIVDSKYFLLEEALLDITESLKAKFPSILAIKVKINKPNILSNCNVGVEIQKKY